MDVHLSRSVNNYQKTMTGHKTTKLQTMISVNGNENLSRYTNDKYADCREITEKRQYKGKKE